MHAVANSIRGNQGRHWAHPRHGWRVMIACRCTKTAIKLLQVLVATAEMAWGMTLAAQLVVIMGTQYFDGTGAGGTDYPVTDLLQVHSSEHFNAAVKLVQDDRS